MKVKTILISALILAVGISLFYFVPSSAASDRRTNINLQSQNGVAAVSYISGRFSLAPVEWQTIVNNNFLVPGTKLTYSNYGLPSVNSDGYIVFRALAAGKERQFGIYARQFPKGPVETVANLDTYVPYPNNLDTTFSVFPAIPRIAANTNLIAVRGNHLPVYEYLLPNEMHVGTSGIYAQLDGGLLVNGASNLGLVPGFEYYAVPKTFPAAAFDRFYDSPAIADNGTIAFKGGYTVDRDVKTGIYFRELLSTPGGGRAPVELIANSDTEIPNAPPSFRALTFGSLASPTIADNQVVFTGLDDAENPNFGGIYLAPLTQNTKLRTLVGIGEELSGLKIPALTRLGDELSFDGRYVAFWGAWGIETKSIRLYCPTDGDVDLIAYCNGVDPNSIFDKETERWYQERKTMVNQGIFVYDIFADVVALVAHTDGEFADFRFWDYTGRVPGLIPTPDTDLPRWQPTSYLAVSDGIVVFKARTGWITNNGLYNDPTDGIYMRDVVMAKPIEVLLETGMDGVILDPTMPTGLRATVPIVGLGVERDGFRGNRLAINATMADDVTNWGGVYMANISRGRRNDPQIVKKSK